MATPEAALTPAPGRLLLRIAGVLSQLSCAACLLVGTIGLVLVQQNKAGGLVYVGLWLAVAMAGLVFGGLVYRGGVVAMVIAAAIDAGFGAALVTFDGDTLRALLKILPPSDIAAVGDALTVAGAAMLVAAALCLAALPQGIRYARWFRGAAVAGNAMSTAPGFPPPPVPARGSVYIMPADVPPASRRWLYLVLGGLAIGVGTAVGVLVSSGDQPAPPFGGAAARGQATVVEPPPAADGHHAASATAGVPGPSAPVAASTSEAPVGREPAAPVGSTGESVVRQAIVEPAAEPDARPRPLQITQVSADPAAVVRPAIEANTVQQLIAAERAAIATADPKAFADLVIPAVFGFGVDAGEVADGRDAVVAQLARDLGPAPPGGFKVESKALAIGQDRDHAWIAQELEVSGPGQPPRRFAISELAAAIDGSWRVVVLHWANPLDDATAERLASGKALAAPRPIANRRDGTPELDRAVRVAFMNRLLFARATSERPDAFNLGSGGERARGAAIKRVFSKIDAQIQVHDGARVVDGSAWDPAQRGAPWIGWAALNVDFTAPTHHMRPKADVTQTFRVLAIAIKDGADWKLVQTQWSNGGPFRAPPE